MRALHLPDVVHNSIKCSLPTRRSPALVICFRDTRTLQGAQTCFMLSNFSVHPIPCASNVGFSEGLCNFLQESGKPSKNNKSVEADYQTGHLPVAAARANDSCAVWFSFAAGGADMAACEWLKFNAELHLACWA